MALGRIRRQIDEVGGIETSGDGVVVVAGESRGGGAPDDRDGLCGFRSVSDHITETDDPLRPVAPRVVEDGGKGDLVRVDIGKEGVDHGLILVFMPHIIAQSFLKIENS